MRFLKNTSLVALIGLGLAACDSTVGNDDARVTLRLTDAPGDFVAAEVQIEEIYLQGSSDDGSDRIVLYDGGETFDLLTLTDGVTELLAEGVVVPAGNYSQLRVVVGEASITTEGGDTYSTGGGSLQCPSCSQSGLKINLPGGSVRLEGDSNILLVDFDVAQSFGHQAGGSGRWVMHPVLTATDFQATGSLSGQVTLAEGVQLPATCGGSAVDLTAFVPQITAGEIVLSGSTDAEGALSFPFVAPGIFSLGYDAEVEFDNGETLEFTAEPSVSTVTIASGGSASADYTVTGATCVAATS
jgi:Domain of unknown function (DUF4382)